MESCQTGISRVVSEQDSDAREEEDFPNSSETNVLETFRRRLDAIAWNLPRPASDFYLPPEQAWPDPSVASGEHDPLLPPAA